MFEMNFLQYILLFCVQAVVMTQKNVCEQHDIITIYDIHPSTEIGIDNYVKSRFDPKLSSRITRNFGFCVWVNPLYLELSSTIFSYNRDDSDNEILIDIPIYETQGQTEIRFFNKGEVAFQTFRTIEPRTWTHLCVLASTVKISIYINGKLLDETEGQFGPLSLDGYLILGQDQDSPNGDFTVEQRFVGSLSEPRIWVDNINVSNIQSDYETNLSQGYASLTWSTVANVTKRKEFICNLKRKIEAFVIPVRMGFDQSYKACDILGFGRISPKNVSQLEYFSSKIDKQSSICTGSFISKQTVWLDFQKKEDKWYDSANSLILFINKTNNSDIMSRDNFLTVDADGEIHSFSNKESKICTMCVINNEPNYIKPLYLHGICSKSIRFFANVHFGMNYLSFVSNIGLAIALKNETWTLFYLVNEKVIGSLTSNEFPLGRKWWNLPSKYQRRNLPRCAPGHGDEYMNNELLVLSYCNGDHFTCNNGTCIAMEKRCDGVYNCGDGSDEKHCSVIEIPIDQYKRIPPIVPLPVNITALITKFSKVSISNQNLEVSITIELEWRDMQIKFLNLKPNTNLREDDTAKIWIPNLKVLNSDKLQGEYKESIHFVMRTSNFSRIKDNLVYEGSENTLVQRVQITTNIICDFNLIWYPFDKQVCFIKCKLENSMNNSIALKVKHMMKDYEQYQGKTEYTLGNVLLNTSTDHFDINFDLHRAISYHIVSTYLPVFLLHWIGYGTMFIRFDNFQDRGTMSLTTLLVLISLYTDIMGSLPVTSYIKFIDVWSIFSVSYLSSIIAVHLITNDSSTVVIKVGISSSSFLFKNSFQFFKTMRWIFGLILVTFYCVYWILGSIELMVH